MDGTCSGDILGQVPNSENCCRPVVAGGLGGSGFRIPGDEVCTSCNSMIGISWYFSHSQFVIMSSSVNKFK